MRLPVGWSIIWGTSPSLIEDVADDGEAVTRVLSGRSANRPPILEVLQPARLRERRRDAAPDRPAEQPERAVDPCQAVRRDLLLL
jgi:hypothetical protein